MLFTHLDKHKDVLTLENWTYNDEIFSVEECDKIIEYAETLEEKYAMIGDTDNPINFEFRKSKVCWILPNNDSYWIFDRMFYYADMMNARFYRFNLVGCEMMQYTKYKKKKHKYDVHVDYHVDHERQLVRKLSGVLFLSDPSEYEGGKFQIIGKDSIYTTVEQKRGRVIFFPSFFLHRVTPVTSGTRRSLVIWLMGPPFV